MTDVVVGSGPNGLAAAIVLARAGRSVLVREAAATIGGGTRSAELTLPGFIHDYCATVVPLTVDSPFFNQLPLANFGLAFAHPPIALAHPFDDGTAAILDRSIAQTAASLGPDGNAYIRLMAPLVASWPDCRDVVLGPLRWPHHPIAAAHFGILAIRSASSLAHNVFAGPRARALFAGLALHGMIPLEQSPSAAFGLVLGVLGHVVGWPVVRRGAWHISDALASYFRSIGGEIATNATVESLADLPIAPSKADAALFDVTPKQLLQIAGPCFSPPYRWQLGRFRYGPGVFKMDWALRGPVPWRAAECSQAGTVHLGGTIDELAASERAVWRGEVPERPYVIVVQASVADPSRAPAGCQTLWAYCHVPNGSTVDMTERIEAQIERFAPGFRLRILARTIMSPSMMAEHNPNNIGGNINGGVEDLWQLYTRPTFSLDPYRTSAPGLYLCSSSTPPGGGVHGMCGYWAAQAVLRAG